MASSAISLGAPSVLDHAIAYAVRGLFILPCHYITPSGRCSCSNPKCSSQGKHPRTQRGLLDASADPEVITAWWGKWPNSNIGIATGKASGIAVLDVDIGKGGEDSLAALFPEGPIQTAHVITGSGGSHYWFRHPGGNVAIANSASVLAPGLDVRGDGGYVLAPPSSHLSGRRYAWEASSELPPDLTMLAPWPMAVVDAPRAENGRTTATAKAPWKAEVWPEGQRDDSLYRSLCAYIAKNKNVGFDALLTVAAGENQLRCVPPLSIDDVKRITTSALRFSQPATAETTAVWQQGLLRKARGSGLVSCYANIEAILSHDERLHGSYALDTLASDVVCNKKLPWHSAARNGAIDWDSETANLRRWLADNYLLDAHKGDAYDAIEHVAKNAAYHPVEQYLRNVKHDGVPRIACFFSDHLGTDNSEYHQLVAVMFFVQAVARAISPGCKAHGVLVIGGKQRIGKSSLFAALAGPWYVDSELAIGTRNGYQSMRGSWIREIPEFNSVLRVDPALSKAFFTSAVDTYIPPYGRKVVSVPRTAVFGGTWNPNGNAFSSDPTGAGRYWVVESRVDNIDFEAIETLRDQLWAEAFAMYLAGAKWWVSPGTAEFETVWEVQESLYDADPIERKIANWATGMRSFYMDEVLSAIDDTASHWTRPLKTSVGIALKRLGYDRRYLRANGKLVRGPYEKNATELRD
jgi:predicted P-loop ATPase